MQASRERARSEPPSETLLDASASADSGARTARRRGWLWLVIVLLAALGGAAWLLRQGALPQLTSLLRPEPPPTPAARIIPVATATVSTRDLELYLNGLGTVTALKTVVIRSRVDGELTNIAFKEGQLVREGDLLAEIDRRPFEVQRDQAAGQLARDEATLRAAKLNLERLERLAKSNAASKQEVDNQIALVQQTEGIIKSDQAMVADAELQLTYCRIVSPIDGRIGLRLMDVGNIVRANDPSGLAVITQLKPIAIVFTISQDDIPRVQKRVQEGEELRVDCFDRGFTTKLATGKLLATDNQVDPTTGTLRLKAVVEDNTQLFPNQFVNTRLLVDVRHDALVVPSAAVQRGPNSSFVYVVKSDDTVELRNVVVGPSEGAETSIESGLESGELVVTDGIDKLQPGAKVSARDPQSPRSGPSADSEKPAVKRLDRDEAEGEKAAR